MSKTIRVARSWYCSQIVAISSAVSTSIEPFWSRLIASHDPLRLSRDLYERWGPKIGESDVNSRRYEPGEDGFPNRWIGQREGAPEPSLERAESPMAFYYRTIAGRSHFAPGKRGETAFEEACEYSLEVYKANFPVAVDPNDLETEYVTVEQASEPWHDFQVPPGWEEKYADNGGLPPLKRDLSATLSEREKAIVDRHGPGGSGRQWFASRDEGIEWISQRSYRELLIAVDRSHYTVTDVFRSGAGGLVFDVEFDTVSALLSPDSDGVHITYELEGGAICVMMSNGEKVTQWEFADIDELGVAEVAAFLERLGQDLPAIINFANLLISAAPSVN